MLAFLLGTLLSFLVFFALCYIIVKYSDHIFEFNTPNQCLEEASQETIFWINSFFSGILSHFRNDDDNTILNSTEKLNEAMTKVLPPGFSFELDSIGHEIEAKTPLVVKDSIQDGKFLKVVLPLTISGSSFTIWSNIHNFNIPLFEFDFRKVVFHLCFKFEETSKTKITFSNFSVFDVDVSLLVNKRKFMLTNCPVFGSFVKQLFLFFLMKREFEANLPSLETVRDVIEKQEILSISFKIA
ncbi:hypothetical protein TRFO_20571 [Tritrichomonas foetus]|uniref:SMP-LTD domain-containing protein n=1 Tax=Tritrichomonas foetus TaxID=1144522 RepID=A0A1J4KK18_9EUKA|nr:hypothetical protein TRFO_20571 [Tritrichomonas foetus]|eukprot:OHT10196.1 hypothetical protein TRFO_20571 [Tritrichomonas foetus]